jgi:4-amino-4-deoxychorismate lyase
VIVFKPDWYPERYYSDGMKVITSTIPIKPPFFARIKSTNYLPNVLVALEANTKGADNGIFVDQRGMVAEGSQMNAAFVTQDRVFRHPPFDAILSGITIQRVLEFARRLVNQGELKEIRLADIPVAEARQAAEMMLIGSSIKIAPVVEWDGQPIGNGKPGPIAKRLLQLWHEDVATASDQLVPVPYDEPANIG